MIPMDQRKNLIEKESQELSLSKQCELLNISRSSLNYTPSVASSLELEVMKNIDFLYTEDSTRGTRRMCQALKCLAIDISYIPLKKGYMYLFAIIDIYSRYIVGWSLSNTMTDEWVVNSIYDAILRYGSPKIINSDQGSQFTSEEYISFLK